MKPHFTTHLRPEDWHAVAEIYREGIAAWHATFQTTVPSWDEWDRGHRSDCRIVARTGEENDVVGWAALTPVSGRCVYAGVAEVSVYVAAAVRGNGVGTKLLRALIAESEAAGLWTLQAGIFPENVASLAVHAGCGFRVVGRREKIGRMNNRWRDVLLLERRSPIVGSE
ncbi:MAG TPA: GNAT family N-acetyltransferase [Fimbriiglobus sp.]|jgi:phosphinothricin acetyltransferase